MHDIEFQTADLNLAPQYVCSSSPCPFNSLVTRVKHISPTSRNKAHHEDLCQSCSQLFSITSRKVWERYSSGSIWSIFDPVLIAPAPAYLLLLHHAKSRFSSLW